MKNSSLIQFLLIGITILFATFECPGQDNPALDSMQHKLHTVAREIMTKAKTCTLITLDESGQPAARIMDPFPPENDFTVWFGTNLKSRKVGQIERDPRATLFYVSPDMSGYVMMKGNAETVNHPEEKARRWKKEWEQFYPGDRDDYLLLRFTPVRIEIVSYPHGIVGDPVTWEPASFSLNQD